MTNRSSLSVVVPVFNEEPNVAALAQKLHDALSASGRDYEIILVDDGSHDETWERVQALLGARHDADKPEARRRTPTCLLTGLLPLWPLRFAGMDHRRRCIGQYQHIRRRHDRRHHTRCR